MIPLVNIVPTRTAPSVTVCIILLNAAALGHDRWQAWLPPFAVVTTILVSALLVWLSAPAVEDRLGHTRFLTMWTCGGLIAWLATQALHPSLLWVTAGTTATLAAHATLFPGSRVLALWPFRPSLPIVEIPWLHFLLVWAGGVTITVVAAMGHQVAGAGTLGLAHVGTAALGVLGARWLPLRERRAVEWWDRAALASRNRQRACAVEPPVSGPW